jgi:endonuclease/exonuclease/phosphatase family metal-dependent hydrolase
MTVHPTGTTPPKVLLKAVLDPHGQREPSDTPPPSTVISRRLRMALLLLAAAVAGWVGSLRLATGPASGARLLPPPRPMTTVRTTPAAGLATACPPRLRLATFNIHTGRGTDRREDLDRIARLLEGFDVVGLNEVRGPYWWEKRDQACRLAERLHLPWLHAPAERRWLYGTFGNAVLARLPCTAWQRIPLARLRGKSCRNVLLVRFTWNGGSLHVLITHLDRHSDLDRREQLRTVGELFLALAEPAVLMGDLNTPRADPALARLLAAPGVLDPLAELDPTGPDHIDWILIRGLRPTAAGMVHTPASDHPLVWVELAAPQPMRRLPPAVGRTKAAISPPVTRR